MKRSCMVLGAALSVLAGSAGAGAVVSLPEDGTWAAFDVASAGSAWLDPLTGETIEFTLTTSSTFTLRVLDVGFAGDQVEVFSNGVSLGATSLVAEDSALFALDATESFGDVRWSQREWLLGPGSYSFTGLSLAAPFGAAGLLISVLLDPTSSVPLPSSLALALLGLGVLSATRRRSQQPDHGSPSQ